MGEIAVERTPLQEMKVDALAYGAKDTGEMGGGAAASILAADKGAKSIGLSMLGTGEGRVWPADAARLMVRAVRDFHRSTLSPLQVCFSLPTYRDYVAVRDRLAGRD